MPSARTAVLEIAAGAPARRAAARPGSARCTLSRIGVLEPIVVDVELRARARIDDVLDRRHHAFVAQPLDERHRDVDAGDELLDEHAGRILLDQLLDERAHRAPVARHRVVADALGRAFVVGLDDGRHRHAERAFDLLERRQIARRHQARARRVDAVLAQHALGEPLVERHRQHVGVGAGVRIVQLLEQRRIERLARAAAAPLGGVEDEIGRERLDARRQVRRRPRDLDLLHLVARRRRARWRWRRRSRRCRTPPLLRPR